MKQLARVYPWLLIAPAVLPVVIWGGLIYPYLVPKTLLFYALSFLSVAAFALLVAHGKTFFWARLAHRETWIPAALLVLAYLASVFGLDFYRSFWSLLARGDGLLMLTCAVADFYLILLYADRAFFDRLTRAVAAIGSFVAVYGVGEWLLGGGRIGSLLGNAAFFAGYLGIALFATLVAARSLSLAWRRAAYAGAALQVLAIVLSATRGTMLALGVAVLVSLIYVALRGEGTRRAASAYILLTLVILGGFFIAFRSELAKVPFEPVARLASIGTNDPDVASRLFIWKNMVQQIAARPLLGVGAEHIDVLFNTFYDPTQIREEWFDRSHNAFLDYAVQYGLGGLLLYLALIASFFVAARRLLRRGERMRAGLFALLAVTYAVQNFFVFDTVSSFWLLLALLAAALASSLADVPLSQLALPKGAGALSWPAAAALVALIVPVSVYPAMAAYDLAHAYLYQRVDPAREVSYLTQGMALGTYADVEYGYEAYDMYVNDQATALTGSARTAAYEEALAILTKNFNRYPYDARTALFLAHALSLAPEGTTTDNGLLAGALARSIKESPKRAQAWYVLVNLSLAEANTHPVGSAERASGYAAARNLLNNFIALVPTLSEPHYVLAQIARATGDTATAASEAAAGKTYYRSDLPTARRAVGYYEGVNDWADAQFFLAEVVRLDPTDYLSLYDLAKITYLVGDPAGADRIVQELRAKDPSLLASDQNFLAAITAYEQSAK